MPESKSAWYIDVLKVEDVSRIVGWRYAPPYEMYNPQEIQLDVFINPVNQYFAVRDPTDRLLGYCCYGPEGRVLGGDYPEDDARTLDIGVAMDPDLVGRGLGAKFVGTVLAYGEQMFQPDQFRVSIAEFNLRSVKTFLNKGFTQVNKFDRAVDGLPFIQLIGKLKASRKPLYE